MADNSLIYADVIAKEPMFTALADLGLALDDLPIDKLLIRLIDLVDSEHLPILADSMSVAGVDGYWLAESDEARRNLIKGAYDLHRYKGTEYAIKLFIKSLGLGEVQIHTATGGKQHNREIKYRDGFHRRGSTERWACYEIEFLSHPISQTQAKDVIKGISSYAPVRCVLTGLKQRAGSLRHNGYILRAGNYYRGKLWLT